ncbi:hypothetical protein Acr_24g0002890 [Actinidia rufa]|uniref:Xylanase inhibitor C-terminal domain-containing protein n=1 Tax=Actinidia rufa TaxID=165716 RepID=A0A7J0GTE7_9ERIC|nr:hypothetical protein Acr_24g0002890 [Actinidia rufa]
MGLRLPRTKTIDPFVLCFRASALGFARVGFRVPQIDLDLGSGRNWTVFRENSMKQVGDDVACLTFVNGRKYVDRAVVIGSFQIGMG